MTQHPYSGWSPRSGYHRSTYPPAGSLPPVRAAVTSPVAAGGWAQPPAIRRRRAGDIATYVLALLGGLGLAVVLFVVYTEAGRAGALILPFLLALVPLGIVLVSVRWLDRWEPEPLGPLVAAFLWGAGVATVVSMIVNTSASLLVMATTGDVDGAELFSAVVTAPVVEEGTKGLGVLLVFLIRRRSFSGPVDGIVYAAVIAAGFAFAENILYFARFSDQILGVFVMRGLASPFAHVTFTACTGLAVGLSARRRSRWAWVWMTPIGLAGAIALHAFWNGVVSVRLEMYLLTEVPFFLACIGIVIALRASERRTLSNRLTDYARSGWYAPTEVTMLTTAAGRATARRWARAHGPAVELAMRDFLSASLQLASLRQQALSGHADADYAARETQLLGVVRRCKQVFLGRP
ncbi:PrsW family intramembrane metalloprotease [Actinomyces respiraculi]|uniref:PrsW family intramembrane metalloprotease n=1 Tax=Actinomyces respiraculi TaxID=2744574 RepID=UPI0014209EE3|nr:PrsW family intramembrane metalloprotease [Actinomyces respiraculi]